MDQREWFRRPILWTRAHVPAGLRAAVGLTLVIGGIFGFLPILGFWMIPLGIGVMALDIPPLARLVERLVGEPGRANGLDNGKDSGRTTTDADSARTDLQTHGAVGKDRGPGSR